MSQQELPYIARCAFCENGLLRPMRCSNCDGVVAICDECELIVGRCSRCICQCESPFGRRLPHLLPLQQKMRSVDAA